MALFQKPSPERIGQLIRLTWYAPELKFTALVPGVDNIRHDVFLSPRLTAFTAWYCFQLILKHSAAKTLVEDAGQAIKPADRNEFKQMIQELLIGALTQARQRQNQELDLLANVALFKYLAWEMQNQYGNILLQGKNKMKQYEGPKHERNPRALQVQQAFSDYQTQKKIILRLVAGEIQRMVNEAQADQVRKTRESFFGPDSGHWFHFFANPLAFTENARDDFIHLEKYALFGNFARDPDRFELLEEWVRWFLGWVDQTSPEARDLAQNKEKLKQLQAELEALKQPQSGKGGLGRLFGSGSGPATVTGEASERIQALTPQIAEQEENVRVLEKAYDTLLSNILNVPENVEEMFGMTHTEQQIAEARKRSAPREEIQPLEEKAEAQRYLLDEFYKSGEKAGVPPYLAAAYETARIYAQFCPPINPQNLKQSLLQPEERKKILDLLCARNPEAQGNELEEAAGRVRAMTARELRPLLVRYVSDYSKHHRDSRYLAVFQGVADRIYLAFDEKARQMSRINGTLYQFFLPDEEQPVSEQITGHAILKADVRDSTRLTSDLMARGLNPATYFSLNFFEPLNRLLPRYGAEKVFIEGDAVILSLFEKEGGAGHAVALTCGLAREMVELVRLYNAKGQGTGLPQLEIGIGICWRNTAPLFLLDGESRIMISEALNLSDRLSGCSKLARKSLPKNESPFNVYIFQTITEDVAGGAMEEFLVRYNVLGICMNEEAFEKLRTEISLTRFEVEMPVLSGRREKVLLHCGSVPVAQGVFQRLVIREAYVPFVDAHTFQQIELTKRRYFEVVTHKAVYDYADKLLASAVASS